MASKKYNLNYIVDMIKNHQKKEENMGNRINTLIYKFGSRGRLMSQNRAILRYTFLLFRNYESVASRQQQKKCFCLMLRPSRQVYFYNLCDCPIFYLFHLFYPIHLCFFIISVKKIWAIGVLIILKNFNIF